MTVPTLNPLKVLIADDEAPARNRLRELLGEISQVTVSYTHLDVYKRQA